MNENARKWIEALRSGKYAQTHGRLQRASGGYCCLGVACDISKLGEWVKVDNVSKSYVNGDESESSVLPQAVAEWLGISSSDGYFQVDDRLSSLLAMNDMGHSFEEIAATIESEPDGLFGDYGSLSASKHRT
jgi:hypothetical protein